MDTEKNRRIHRRLSLRLPVLCQRVGVSENKVYTGNTINVSPGGVLMETNHCRFNDGELLSVEMSVPPTEGLLTYGGRLSTYARVIRVAAPQTGKTAQSASEVQHIALEFCVSPKLNV